MGQRPMPAAAPTGGVLFAVFEGQRYPITKDEFYIGRSNKSCDLVVKDPNVSRQHARVVRHQGQYWMVDMGSTNGIEYNAGRVERRPIQEGDLFRICDHEIAFTYRG
jgi:pSer/pThr/pTyr-binding forkhead associated (FHA) protein